MIVAIAGGLEAIVYPPQGDWSWIDEKQGET